MRSIARRDGTWQLSQRFDPYGRLIVRDSVTGSTIGAQLCYGWTGREWDAETGFSYHRARYFDPESRRCTQEDPIGFAGGMNVYAYVEGSPLEATDPSGLNKSIDYWASVPTIRPSGASARLDALYGWGEANWTAFLLASAYKQYLDAFAGQRAGAAKAGGQRAAMFEGAIALSKDDFGDLVKRVRRALDHFGDLVNERLSRGEIAVNTAWVEAHWTDDLEAFAFTAVSLGVTMLHEDLAFEDLSFAVVHETLHLDSKVRQDELSVNSRTSVLLGRWPDFTFAIRGCEGRRHHMREELCTLPTQ